MKVSKGNTVTVKSMVADKMQLLDDFEICEKTDKKMRKKLMEIVASNPGKDTQIVLDSYCRRLLHKKMESWN